MDRELLSESKLKRIFNRQNLVSLGFAMILICSGIGMYLKLFVANISWVSILSFVSFLLIFNWKNFAQLSFPFATLPLKLMIGYELFASFYFIIWHNPIHSKFGLYNLFTVASLIALISIRKEDLEVSKIIKIFFYISLGCVILGYYCVFSGLYKSSLNVDIVSSLGEDVMDPLTLSGTAISCIVATLYIPFKKYNSYKKIAIILACLYFILILGKRTPIIVATALIVLYLYKQKLLSFQFSPKKVMIISALIIVFILICNQFINLEDQINNVWNKTIGGIGDMINGTNDSGPAARMRYYARIEAIQTINTSNNFHYFLGQGYMSKWLDIPFLQAFLDMGIIGFIWFNGLMFCYPIWCFLKIKGNSTYAMYALFAFSNCLYGVISIFNSGTPYGNHRCLPIAFLMITMQLYLSQSDKFSSSELSTALQ